MGQVLSIVGLYEDLEVRGVFHLAKCQLRKSRSFVGSSQQSD